MKYQKPKIKIKKIKFNFFLSQNRFFDSFDSLLDFKVPEVYAEGGGSCSGCGCGCGCFLPGTKVIMADGVTKEIQDIQSGDLILSYNIFTKNLVKNRVAKLLIHPDIDGDYYIINGKLSVTGNHRMWVNNEVWEKIENLKVGDTFLNSKKEKVKISSIERLKGVNTVYNLHIDAIEHSYFAENVLAHNLEDYKI